MQHSSDHDLLVALSTKVDIFIDELKSKASTSDVNELRCQVNRIYSWVWGLVASVLILGAGVIFNKVSTPTAPAVERTPAATQPADQAPK